jgi:hypothetical protein
MRSALGRRGSPVNAELVDCSLFTRNVQVGLEVFHICMLAYGYMPRGYNQVHSERVIALRDACLAKAHALDMGIAASTRTTR